MFVFICNAIPIARATYYSSSSSALIPSSASEVSILIEAIVCRHPFTVCNVLPSASGNPKAILHVKIYNAWTSVSQLSSRPKNVKMLQQSVDAKLSVWDRYISMLLTKSCNKMRHSVRCCRGKALHVLQLALRPGITTYGKLCTWVFLFL